MKPTNKKTSNDSEISFLRWQNVFGAGVFGGIIVTIARLNFSDRDAITVSLFCLWFFILNKNMNFNWLQKIIAAVLLFFIGLYGVGIYYSYMQN